MISSSSVNRWSVVIAGVIILMCLGVAYSWGVFLLPIDREMGWGRAKISFAVSVCFVFRIWQRRRTSEKDRSRKRLFRWYIAA